MNMIANLLQVYNSQWSSKVIYPHCKHVLVDVETCRASSPHYSSKITRCNSHFEYRINYLGLQSNFYCVLTQGTHGYRFEGSCANFDFSQSSILNVVALSRRILPLVLSCVKRELLLLVCPVPAYCRQACCNIHSLQRGGAAHQVMSRRVRLTRFP